ncbi:MAG: hypothetical protein ACLFVT_07870 [Syntrophobacteria bacterium]
MASTIGFGVVIGFIIGYLVATVQYHRKISSLRSMWNEFVLSQKSR